MKALDEAMRLRNHVLSCLERAAQAADPVERAEWLTFVIVGGGPTGVEYAGALAELLEMVLGRDFPELAPGRPGWCWWRAPTGSSGRSTPASAPTPPTPSGAGAWRCACRRWSGRRPTRAVRAVDSDDTRSGPARSSGRAGVGPDRSLARQGSRPSGLTARPRRPEPVRTAGGRRVSPPAARRLRHRRRRLGPVRRRRRPSCRCCRRRPCRKAATWPGRSAPAASRPGRSATRQGHDGHDRPPGGRGPGRAGAAAGLPRLDHLAGGPPLLPDRVPQPGRRAGLVGLGLPAARPARSG